MTYLKGHKSEEIKQLQIKLGIEADGAFGENTEKAVINFQTDHNLIPSDGVVRQDMLDILFPKPVSVKTPSILDLASIYFKFKQGTLNMNSDQIKSAIRWIIAAVSGAAIAKGIGDATLWEAIGGAAALLVPAIWSFVTHKK